MQSSLHSDKTNDTIQATQHKKDPPNHFDGPNMKHNNFACHAASKIMSTGKSCKICQLILKFVNFKS